MNKKLLCLLVYFFAPLIIAICFYYIQSNFGGGEICTSVDNILSIFSMIDYMAENHVFDACFFRTFFVIFLSYFFLSPFFLFKILPRGKELDVLVRAKGKKVIFAMLFAVGVLCLLWFLPFEGGSDKNKAFLIFVFSNFSIFYFIFVICHLFFLMILISIVKTYYFINIKKEKYLCQLRQKH
jgi:hypothetical protein